MAGIGGNTKSKTIDEINAEVTEIEKHLHNREKWFGIATTATGETHVADRMGGGIAPFVLTAGNDDFGDWVQVLGSDDAPVYSGMTLFDAHRFMVSATNSTSPFITQVIAGESSELAALILTEDFTEAPYISGSNNNDSGISDLMSIRITAGIKVWARTCCIGQNGSTMNFYYGIHEYRA